MAIFKNFEVGNIEDMKAPIIIAFLLVTISVGACFGLNIPVSECLNKAVNLNYPDLYQPNYNPAGEEVVKYLVAPINEELFYRFFIMGLADFSVATVPISAFMFLYAHNVNLFSITALIIFSIGLLLAFLFHKKPTFYRFVGLMVLHATFNFCVPFINAISNIFI